MKEEKKTKTADQKDAEQNKYLAALSYVHILFLVPLLARRDSKFCQFHAKQGLVLFIVQTVIFMVAWFPVIGWMLAASAILVSIIGIFKVLAEEYWEIPYLNKYSQKIKI
jgi:uncharacterized membrane protein